MDEFAATTPSSPLGMAVLVDIFALHILMDFVPHRGRRCKHNPLLYSSLCTLSKPVSARLRRDSTHQTSSPVKHRPNTAPDSGLRSRRAPTGRSRHSKWTEVAVVADDLPIEQYILSLGTSADVVNDHEPAGECGFLVDGHADVNRAIT